MFGNLFGSKPTPEAAPSLPLGLRLGGAVEIDGVIFNAHPGAFGFEPPAGNQIIEALGTCDLGGGTHLYRFYLSDDAWIQVKTTSGDVDDIKLFVFADTVNPANAAAFQQWTEAGSELGQPKVTFSGHTYTRVWGDATQPGWAPPVAYDEKVTHPSGGEEDFDLTHYSMLYQRELPDVPGRFEYLFITAEDYGPNKFDVVYSLGIDVTTADLSIT
ncbi:DUF2491 family protein [Dyella subtropica]|uniref:DUF2491 family protein n=1 Tax=Dyella subtropica TaxID=2992127 RepID=UPI0022526C3B|nr:DUF2491 family protein [Dyella subtropica]